MTPIPILPQTIKEHISKKESFLTKIIVVEDGCQWDNGFGTSIATIFG
jgi:hypothetical protein